MLEFIAELILELFSIPIESFFESKRIKPWVKNLFTVLFWGAVEALLVWVTSVVIRGGNPWPMCLMAIVVTLIWTFVGKEMWKNRHR